MTSSEGFSTVKLACVGCGANLDITNDIDNFTCQYCGTKQIVKRGGGVIHLKQFESSIREIRNDTSRTAAELAIKRLEGELREAKVELREFVEHHQPKKKEDINVFLVAASSVLVALSLTVVAESIKLSYSYILIVVVIGIFITRRALNINKKNKSEFNLTKLAYNNEVSDLEDKCAAIEKKLKANREIVDSA